MAKPSKLYSLHTQVGIPFLKQFLIGKLKMGIESNATNLKMKTCGLVHCVALFCACHELMSRLISKSNTRVSVAKMVTWSASRSSSMWWDDTLAFTHFYKKRRATMQWWWYEVWTLARQRKGAIILSKKSKRTSVSDVAAEWDWKYYWFYWQSFFHGTLFVMLLCCYRTCT